MEVLPMIGSLVSTGAVFLTNLTAQVVGYLATLQVLEAFDRPFSIITFSVKHSFLIYLLMV